MAYPTWIFCHVPPSTLLIGLITRWLWIGSKSFLWSKRYRFIVFTSGSFYFSLWTILQDPPYAYPIWEHAPPNFPLIFNPFYLCCYFLLGVLLHILQLNSMYSIKISTEISILFLNANANFSSLSKSNWYCNYSSKFSLSCYSTAYMSYLSFTQKHILNPKILKVTWWMNAVVFKNQIPYITICDYSIKGNYLTSM